MEKIQDKINRFYIQNNDVETEPITKPAPTETPDTDKRKYPNPSTPPQPDVKPGPKN
jgi:hypothetical protein